MSRNKNTSSEITPITFVPQVIPAGCIETWIPTKKVAESPTVELATEETQTVAGTSFTKVYVKA